MKNDKPEHSYRKKEAWPGAGSNRYCLCGSKDILYIDRKSTYCAECMPVVERPVRKTRSRKKTN